MSPELARALFSRARVEVPRSLSVTWGEGARWTRPDHAHPSADGERYDLDALACDVRQLVGTVRPKGEGQSLCGATFGDLDGPATVEFNRRAANLQRATLVQIDNDGKPGDRGTYGAAVEVLRGLDVAAVGWPSPSARGPAATSTRWRFMLAIAPVVPSRRGAVREVSPASREGRRVLVACLSALVEGLRLDAGKALDAIAVAFVHPAHEPRAPGDVVRLDGAAVDLDALAHAAADAGIIARPSARARAGEWDRGALVALFRSAGLVVRSRGAVDALECPIAAEHSGPTGAGDDTSCAIYATGAKCSHDHGGRGWLLTPALVDLALARIVDPLERERHQLAVRGTRTRAAEACEELAAPVVAAQRLNPLDVGDWLADVGRELARAVEATGKGAAALVTASPGAGKSRGVAELLHAAAPAPAHYSRETPDGAPVAAPANPLPVAAVLVDQRARIEDMVRVLVRRSLPVVATPVSRVVDVEGKPVCIHAGAAAVIEAARGNARDLLCVQGRCERAKQGCAAHDPATAWGARPDGTVGPGGAVEAGADAPRVYIGAHAAGAPQLARGAVLVVDEACAAPWLSLDVADDEPAPLAHARALAGWLRNEALAALVRAVLHALHARPAALREVPPAARLAWSVDAAVAHLEAHPAALARIDPQIAREGGPVDVRGRVVEALERWARRRDGFNLVASRAVGNHNRVRSWRDGSHGVAAGAGNALDGFRAWLDGAPVMPVEAPGDDPSDPPRVVGSKVSWEAPATRALRAHVEGGGAAVMLDATGDEGVARAMLAGVATGLDGAEPHSAAAVNLRVHRAALDDRCEVSRVLVVDSRGTSRSQLRRPSKRNPRGAVQWGKLAPSLAALARLVADWRAAHPSAAPVGAVLSRQIIARTLAAFWRVGEGLDVAAGVARACEGLTAGGSVEAGDVARELAALCAHPRAVEAATALRAALPAGEHTYPGSALARGSNALRGVSVLASLGDFRARPDEAAAVAVRTGRDPMHEAEREAGATLVQWFGRARVSRREEPCLMVAVGQLAPPDWRGAEGVRVIEDTAAAARDGLALPVAPAPAPVVSTSTKPPPSTPAALALARCVAAGWRVAELAARLAPMLGCKQESVYRQLHRIREGAAPRDPDVLRYLDGCARTAPDALAALRARFCGMARGRTVAALWRGVEHSGRVQVRGVRHLAARAGVSVPLEHLERWAAGTASADEAAAVVAVLSAPWGDGDALGDLERERGIDPPSTIAPERRTRSTLTERSVAAAAGRVVGATWEPAAAVEAPRKPVKAPGVRRAAPTAPVAAETPRGSVRARPSVARARAPVAPVTAPARSPA